MHFLCTNFDYKYFCRPQIYNENLTHAQTTSTRLVVRLSVIKAKTRPGIEDSLRIANSAVSIVDSKPKSSVETS